MEQASNSENEFQIKINGLIESEPLFERCWKHPSLAQPYRELILIEKKAKVFIFAAHWHWCIQASFLAYTQGILAYFYSFVHLIFLYIFSVLFRWSNDSRLFQRATLIWWWTVLARSFKDNSKGFSEGWKNADDSIALSYIICSHKVTEKRFSIWLWKREER